MARGDLSDHEWQQLEPLLPPQKTGKKGNPYKDHRTVVNGILWVLRTGAPWRDIPSRYGPWGTCSTRFHRWTKQGVWQKALETLQAQAEQNSQLDWDVTALDGSYIKAHSHAAGAKKGGPPPRRARASRRSDAAEAD
jgi:transposase